MQQVPETISAGINEICDLIRNLSRIVKEFQEVPEIFRTTCCYPEFGESDEISIEDLAENWISIEDNPQVLEGIFEDQIELPIKQRAHQHQDEDDVTQRANISAPKITPPNWEQIEVAMDLIQEYASHPNGEILRLGGSLAGGDALSDVERLNRRCVSSKMSLTALRNKRKQ